MSFFPSCLFSNLLYISTCKYNHRFSLFSRRLVYFKGLDRFQFYDKNTDYWYWTWDILSQWPGYTSNYHKHVLRDFRLVKKLKIKFHRVTGCSHRGHEIYNLFILWFATSFILLNFYRFRLNFNFFFGGMYFGLLFIRIKNLWNIVSTGINSQSTIFVTCGWHAGGTRALSEGKMSNVNGSHDVDWSKLNRKSTGSIHVMRGKLDNHLVPGETLD